MNQLSTYKDNDVCRAARIIAQEPDESDICYKDHAIHVFGERFCLQGDLPAISILMSHIEFAFFAAAMKMQAKQMERFVAEWNPDVKEDNSVQVMPEKTCEVSTDM